MIRRLLVGLMFLANLLMLHRFMVSDQGYEAYQRLVGEHEHLRQEVEDLKDESVDLSQEIRWLQKGGPHMEKVIRERTNFLRDDEVVYMLTDDEHRKP